MTSRTKIVGLLKDGDTIVEHEWSTVIGTLTFVEVTVPVLVTIDKVIELHSTATSPKVNINLEPQMISVVGKVVGFTIGAAAGTTCTLNICCVGF